QRQTPPRPDNRRFAVAASEIGLRRWGAIFRGGTVVSQPTMAPRCTRRSFAALGIAAATGAAALWLPGAANADSGGGTGANPDIAPVPIPWLDANGFHNQPPAPGNDPAEIFDFDGQVATCQLAGTGKDGQGKPV